MMGLVRTGVMLLVMGLAVGLAAALTVVRVMRGLLYGVALTDLLTFTAVPIVLALVALWATYAPARRATDVAPIDALRAE